MRVLKTEANRRVAFLIAEKSMRRRFVGLFSRLMGSIPVARALDTTKPGPGKVYLPDPQNDPCLVRGVGTHFDKSQDVQTGGLLVLPTVNGTAASAEILEVHGPEELRLKKEFRGADAIKQLTGREDVDQDGRLPQGGDAPSGPAPGYEGINYKLAPKVDQTRVYNAVFESMNKGGCVGIFPEGGSHDRTELLPLKGM
jgi:glycerol-3-phosphate O-acyltransferase/dihydroxyacetone phosphate acyltransferase